jgi:hypothetical protein
MSKSAVVLPVPGLLLLQLYREALFCRQQQSCCCCACRAPLGTGAWRPIALRRALGAWTCSAACLQSSRHRNSTCSSHQQQQAMPLPGASDYRAVAAHLPQLLLGVFSNLAEGCAYTGC